MASFNALKCTVRIKYIFNLLVTNQNLAVR